MTFDPKTGTGVSFFPVGVGEDISVRSSAKETDDRFLEPSGILVLRLLLLSVELGVGTGDSESAIRA